MKHIASILIFICSSLFVLNGQNVSINEDGSAPDPSAMLDVSDTTKGMLIPRLTISQRDAITNPATGLLIFQTDSDSGFYFNQGIPSTPSWLRIKTESDSSYWSKTDTNLHYNQGNVGIGTDTPEGLLHLYGRGSLGAGGRLVFGDDYRSTTNQWNTFIGEMGWNSLQDSDALQVHGRQGTYFTVGSPSNGNRLDTAVVINSFGRLELYQAKQANLFLRMHADTGQVGLLYSSDSSYYALFSDRSNGTLMPSGSIGLFGGRSAATSGVRWMVDEDGKMGIGNSAPTDALQIGDFNKTQNQFLSIKTAGGNAFKSGIRLMNFSDTVGFELVSDDTQNKFYINKFLFDTLTVFTISGINGNVGIGTTSPETSAILDVSDTTRGFLPPRMNTTQMNSISSPASGLFIYNTDSTAYMFYNGITWVSVTTTEETKFSVPVGTILPFGGDKANLPSGFLVCNGALVDNTTYSDLFASIGYSWGGSGTNFNLPDLRGRFLRGVNDGSGNDPNAGARTAIKSGGNTGDNVGSIQADENKSHAHIVSWDDFDTRSQYTNTPTNLGKFGDGDAGVAMQYWANGGSYSDDPGQSSGGSESRPKNASVTYIICYSSSLAASVGSSSFQGTIDGGQITGSLSASQLPTSISDSTRITDTDGDTRISVDNTDDDQIRFFNQNNQSMLIDSSGNVAIGHDDPKSMLHLQRDTGDVIIRLQADQDGDNNNDNPAIYFYQDAGQKSAIGREGVAGTEFTNSLNNAMYLGQEGSRPVQFYTDDKARMTLTGDGFVGIGTSIPTVNLTVAGTGKVKTDIYSYASSISDFGALNFVKARGTEDTPTAVVNNDIIGKLGGFAYDGSDFSSVASISYEMDGIPTVGDVPGRMQFHTTPAGSTIAIERMRINSEGNVGIGTTSPENPLHIVSDNTSQLLIQPLSSTGNSSAIDIRGHRNSTTSSLVAQVNFQNFDNDLSSTMYLGTIAGIVNNATANIGDLAFYNYADGTTRTEAMRLNSDGLFGIGTSSPSELLHLSKSNGDAILLIEADTDNDTELDNPSILFKQDAGAVSASIGLVGTTAGSSFSNAIDNSLLVGHISNKPLQFATNSSVNMTILGDGNVGIGLTNPITPLHIDGGSDAELGSGGFLLIGEITGNNIVIDDNEIMSRFNGFTKPFWINKDGGDVYVGNNSVFEDGGDVGIGTTSPSHLLEIVEDKSNGYLLRVENTNTSNNADGMIISIGRTSNMTNDNKFIAFEDGSGTDLGLVRGNGSGGINYYNASDRRLKENITDLSNALDIVLKMRPRNYNFKTAKGMMQDGFIAQELQKIYPQSVSGNPEGDVKEDPMMVDYGSLTPLLTKAIQEQQFLIDQQNQNNEKQQYQIEFLIEELKILKQKVDSK